jgi:hypothetical protein
MIAWRRGGFTWQMLLLSTCGVNLSAQDVSAVAVSGTVLDPHQAAVAGTSMSLRRTDGNEVQSTAAGVAGDFRFQGVPPGNYELRIEHPGFKPSTTRIRVGNQSPRPLTLMLTALPM